MKGEPLEGSLFWALGIVAAFFVGLSKGGLASFSMLAVPILSLVISPITAAGLLLPVFLFSDVFGVWAYRRNIRWDVLKIACVGALLGCAIGWLTAEMVSENMVRVLIGVIGAAFALNYLIRRNPDTQPHPPTWGRGMFWTTIAGFTSFVSHAGAPPWQVWVIPLNLGKIAFAGTTTMVFAFMNASKVVPYFLLGQLGTANLKVAALLVFPALAGVFVGYQLTRALSDRVFFGIIAWALLAVSLKLIYDGVWF